MGNDQVYFEGSKNPCNLFRSIGFDLRFFRENPDYFEPCGIWVFCGAQGSGKTLSAVKCVKRVMKEYPKALLCSNIVVKGFEDVTIPFTDYEQLLSLTNGIKGIIFLIDEIQVLWNSLESKNIPVSEMAIFAQMRKDRRLIIGTSQVYGRIAKPIREQLRYVVKCRNILKYIQVNELINPNPDGYTAENDGQLDGELLKTEVFFHSPADYQAYDTLAKVNRFQRGAKKNV